MKFKIICVSCHGNRKSRFYRGFEFSPLSALKTDHCLKMETSVAELMENLSRMEDLTNAHMNELASVRQDTLSVKWKLTRCGEKSKELESSFNSSMDLLSSKQFDHLLLEHREKTLKDQMLPEKMKAMETEKSSLEQLHSQIWQARRDFCERAKEFSKQDGFLASNCNNNDNEEEEEEEVHHELVCPELLPKVNDEELKLLEAEIASLEMELAKMNDDISTLIEKLKCANGEIEILTNEPTVGTDFIRLQEARTYSENQVDVMESRCKKVQEEIISIEKLIQSLTLEQKAPEVVYHEYANIPGNKYSNQNMPQSYSAKNYGKIKSTGLKSSVSLETSITHCERQEPQAQYKRKTPSKVTFASNAQYDSDQENNHNEKLLLRAEHRIKEMQAARDAFACIKGDATKMMKTGVTADWLQAYPALPKASVTEDIALRASEIPKKKVFVPKNPSALALKFGSANKTLPSFENKDCTGIVRNKPTTSALKVGQTIPTKPTRDKVMELGPTVERGKISVEMPGESKLPPSSSRTSILKHPSRMPYIS